MHRFSGQPEMAAPGADPTIKSKAFQMRYQVPKFGILSTKCLRHHLERVVGLLVVGARPLGQFYLRARHCLIGNVVEQVRDDVEARSPLVVRPRNEPRRPCTSVLFALGRRRQGDHPKDARADPFVIALMVPPLPAPSRPSNTMQTFAPACLVHS